MYAYREYAKNVLGINNPEMVLNESAHLAFIKASEFLNIKAVMLPIN